MTADVAALRHAFSGFPCGVAALAAVVDGAPTVLVASSFTVGVSQDPPLVMFAVQHTSTTWPVLREAHRIGVSVLGDAHAGLVRQLASADRSSRFDGVSTTESPDGALGLAGSPVWMECSVEHVYPAGDHDVVVLRVHDLAVEFEHQPLVWHRSVFSGLAPTG
jgi:flavin reductase (DIM6/NTAB) family NADH-FMN oxidoreductase RutF